MPSEDHRREDADARSAAALSSRRAFLLAGTSLAALAVTGDSNPAQAQQRPSAQPSPPSKPPNILVIWGDDIGWQNVSVYGMGTMGYTTPNIDRVGMEGIRFTDQ